MNKKFNNQQTFASLTRQTTREAQKKINKDRVSEIIKLRHKNDFVELSVRNVSWRCCKTFCTAHEIVSIKAPQVKVKF